MPADAPRRIEIERWEQGPADVGLVHIIHGMSEHPGRYDAFARALNAGGFVVWAHHQRGHGKDSGPRGHFGDRNGWQGLVDDAWQVSSELRTRYPHLPLLLFAHSMGSFVGQDLLAQHPNDYAAAVLSGTNGSAGVRERALLGWAAALGWPRDAAARLLQTTVFNEYNRGFGSTPNSWLSSDAGEVAKYNADPDCRVYLTWQAWMDLLRGRFGQSSRAAYAKWRRDLPLRIMSGRDDPVGEFGKGVERLITSLQKAGLSQVDPDLHAGKRHELLHEVNRAQVMAGVIHWMRTHV